MKFWQKLFIGVLIIFIAAINICIYLTSQYSFSLNMRRDTDRALGEYHFIINGVYDAMNTIYYRNQADLTTSSIESIMRSYADYYKSQNIFLELKKSNEILYTNIPSAISDIDTGEPSEDSYTIKVLPGKEGNYLVISGKEGIPYTEYTLTYVRNLSELYDTHAKLTRYLITVSVIVEMALSLILLLLLRKLTDPIRTMQKAARKIAGGEYEERLSIPGRDEFHDLAENFNQMAASIQDKITELDRNARNKQRLIDNLAHELRTPLTAIRGYAEYLQNANTNEPNRIKAANYIVSETDRLKNLAFKLLDLALLRNNKLDIRQNIPMDLFDRIKSELISKLTEKNIKLEMESSLNALPGDLILLQSLLVNLLDNAIKASSNDSVIWLSAYFDKVPILEVRDSGCGMEEDEASLVCEPFYRVDKARSRSSGGVGLGLSLCREIAHLHGAELKINSRPGKGTIVQVVFTTPLQLPENSVMPSDV